MWECRFFLNFDMDWLKFVQEYRDIRMYVGKEKPSCRMIQGRVGVERIYHP